MKSIFQKEIIPARTQSQDKKFQTSRPCEVGSFQTFVLLTKTAINRDIFNLV